MLVQRGMKRIFTVVITVMSLAAELAAAPSAPVQIAPAVIPAPVHLQVSTGKPGFAMGAVYACTTA